MIKLIMADALNKCPKCNKSFKTPTTLKQHLARKKPCVGKEEPKKEPKEVEQELNTTDYIGKYINDYISDKTINDKSINNNIIKSTTNTNSASNNSSSNNKNSDSEFLTFRIPKDITELIVTDTESLYEIVGHILRCNVILDDKLNDIYGCVRYLMHKEKYDKILNDVNKPT